MKRKLILLFLLLVLHIFLLVNLRFTAWPEMFSYPYLRNNGFLIYKDMVHPYTPVLTMTLSTLYKLFGYRLIVLKLFTWVLVLINDVLIFLIVKKISKSSKVSLLSVLFYLFTQPFLDGNMLWFDFAISTPLLFSFYFLLKVFDKQSFQKRNLLFTGLFLMVAVLIKQTSGLYFLAVLGYLILKRTKFQKIIPIFIGPLVLGLPLLFRLIQEGALMDFLNWVLIYPARYWTKFPGYVRMDVLQRDVFTLFLILAPSLVVSGLGAFG